MAEILDIIDEKADPKESMQSIRDNFKTIQNQTLKAGPYLLASASVKTAQNVTSATYVDLTAFKGSLATSGGLVTFQFSIFALVTAANGSYALYVDDVEVAWASVGIASSVLTNIPLVYSANLNAGNHTWKIKAKVSAGTMQTGYYSTTATGSNFSIIEFLRG